jgi:signal transduction histidine kinase
MTEGYRMVAQAQDETAWAQLDLGGTHTIDEIRLIPARPTDAVDTPGWGFPKAFRVDVATDRDLSDAVPYGEYSFTDHVENRPLILPSETRHMLPVGGPGRLKESTTAAYPANSIDARYVRLTVTEYDPRLKPSQFALAEFQVYSGDSNVALDATVTVSHVPTDEEDKAVWAPEYLVDEFSSRARLLEYPVWLDHLKKRRRIEQQLAETTSRLDEEVGRVWMQLGVGVGLTLMAAIGGMLWYTSWNGARMQTQTADLRNQIASDLHDDIGSNLGAIALLCQTISIRADIPSELHDEFEEIREVALETSDSMRDIVWLMRTSTSSLAEFVGRLRGTAARMLHQCDVTFHESSERPDVMIPLNWRRSVFLSFKEVLHNAARHSQATRVRIQLDVDDDGMRILVEDDGVGFDLRTRREGGLGINSITARASELGGHSDFRTAPEQGTTVTLEIPFVHPGNLWRTLRTRIGRRWAKWTEHRSARRPPPDVHVTRTSGKSDESSQNSTHSMGRSSSIR